uniref:Tc1-like transposase DDE domain-containing protein n=1 Tax=Plectus sambesii TaxID=2011161 RepID=A0A914UU60_9BILA
MKAWLLRHNIPFAANVTKKALFNTFVTPLQKKKYNIYAVKKLAKEHGSIILRLPPYHCGFNPIELVWGWMKKALRDRLSGDDKLSVVMSATSVTLNTLPQTVIRSFLDHVWKTETCYASLNG